MNAVGRLVGGALARVEVRLFLIAWILYSLHFATNVVREHYPAFALIERGDWVCDAYAEMHSDIFPHTREPWGDGHWYTGNNLMGSVIAAVPLLLFDPVLDRIEEETKARQAVDPAARDAHYETEMEVSAAAYGRMVAAGLHLRFAASTIVTSAFLMAPLSALWVALMYRLFRRRSVDRPNAVLLALAFGFATPIFFRTAHLVHNMFVAQAVFGCFWLLWKQDDEVLPYGFGRRFLAGFLGGMCLALDYAGIVPLLVFWAGLILLRLPSGGARRALTESFAFVLGCVPPVLFLLGSQWAMYGTPWYPGQFHMPEVNFTEQGWRGMTPPSLTVFWRNLVDLDWGLVPFGPVLLLGLVPAALLPGRLILPRRERRLSAAFCLAFMLFCSMNRYSLMQWNTGFRYLLPVVPLLFLAASDVLVRLPAPWRVGVVAVSFVQVWVLSMVRFTVPLIEQWRAGETNAVSGTWARFFERGGIQFPWLTRLGQVTPGEPWFESPLLPYPILLVTLAGCLGIWILGARAERSASR